MIPNFHSILFSLSKQSAQNDINCNFILDSELENMEINPTKIMSLRGNNFNIKNTRRKNQNGRQ